MRFMLLMYRDEKVWDVKPEAERLAIRQQAIDRAEALRERGIFGGKDLSRSHPQLGQSALYCVTEAHTRADVDRLVTALEEVTR